MLDKLVLHIPFKAEYLDKTGPEGSERYYVRPEKLGVELVAHGVFVDPETGEKTMERLSTRFESLPSSFSGMAMKVYHEGQNCDPFVAIKCSPCKLLQGHNLFGFDCIEKGATNMLALLAYHYGDLYEMLDIAATEVSELDITYSAFVPDRREQLALMDFLRSISNGQTKARGDVYQTSCYFGSKASRHKRLKVYIKAPEMKNDLKKMERGGFKESAQVIAKLLETDYAKSAIRFESTIMKRMLKRHDVPTNLVKLIKFVRQHPDFYQRMWNNSWADIFAAFEGQELTMMNDDDIYKALCDAHFSYKRNGDVSLIKPNRLFAFYQTMKTMGYDALKAMHSKAQFNKNVADIVEAGISKATLQNLDSATGATVVRLATLIHVDFGQQLPADYQLPDDLFAA